MNRTNPFLQCLQLATAMSQLKKSSLQYNRGIKPKRVTSGGVYLRGLALASIYTCFITYRRDYTTCINIKTSFFTVHNVSFSFSSNA